MSNDRTISVLILSFVIIRSIICKLAQRKEILGIYFNGESVSLKIKFEENVDETSNLKRYHL